MKIYHGIHDLLEPLSDTVVAIGVFDGVHRGHQEILKQTVREAASLVALPVVLTFDIHPSLLLAPDRAPGSITTLTQRAELVRDYGTGIGAMVIAEFTPGFATLSAERFVSDILIASLGARHILVGADFRYGKGRAGTVTSLLDAGAESGFTVTVVPPVVVKGERVSSTQIRDLIVLGDIPAAVNLLGHPFVLQGTVAHGKQLGRTLGYPTANLQPDQPDQILPDNGVYAAIAHLTDGRTVRAAVSVGENPTTDSDRQRKVEAFLMDGFDEDIYGQSIGIDFRQKLRDELRFDSLDALKVQIAADVERVTTLL